jgi:hypothetical protein
VRLRRLSMRILKRWTQGALALAWLTCEDCVEMEQHEFCEDFRKVAYDLCHK